MNDEPSRVRHGFAPVTFRPRQAISHAAAWLGLGVSQSGALGVSRTPTHKQDASFTVQLATPLSPDEALARVLDLRVHDKVIPFTRVSPAVSAEDLKPGSVFVARTGVGPLGFDDPMMIEQIGAAPDAFAGAGSTGAVIVKQGRVLQGRVALQITPDAAGSQVRWRQDVRLPWLPALVQPLAAQVLRLGYRQVLTRLLAG